MQSSSTKKGVSSLSRRRGHKGSSSGLLGSGALGPAIALLGCTAALLSLGLVILFLTTSSSTSTEPGSKNYRVAMKERLAGVPHLLRGNVPPVPIGGTGGAGGGIEKKKLTGVDDETNKEGAKEDDPTHPHADDQNRPAPNKDVSNKVAAPGEYPYPLVATPSTYDIKKSWTPLGGSRYSEYTNGTSPYRITDELKRKSDEVARSRRSFVKQSMKFAWDSYVTHAFGMDEVLPISKRGSNNWGGQGITLVDALDTLWLMNLKDEFYHARDWVKDHLQHEHVGSVSVFETTIRDLGGLLSAYDWSGDVTFLEHAKDLGQRLLKAFNNCPTGIPFGMVSLDNGDTKNLDWSGGNAIVAEVGTLQLEFRYLAKMAKDPTLCAKTDRAFEILKEISPPNGLFPYYVQNMGYGGKTKPSFSNDKLTFGAMADSLYEYMLKVWLQSGKTDQMYREMYDLAIDSMHKELLQTSTPSGLTYIADKEANSGNMDHKMDHLVCFMGGLLALGAYTDPLGLESTRAQRDLRTGKALTYTCYQMYARMNTGISPEYVQFESGRDFQIGRGAPHYLLRPEAVESFFILNYLTGDPVYREWGWEAYQSIEKYCKTEAGYGSLGNVQDTTARPRDKMESFFLAETLKYLYLLQDPDTEVDILHKHVFNTEAHPMRIFPVIDAAVS